MIFNQLIFNLLWGSIYLASIELRLLLATQANKEFWQHDRRNFIIMYHMYHTTNILRQFTIPNLFHHILLLV